MSRSPRIGLTSAQFPDAHLGRTFNGTSVAYARGVAQAGGVPTLLPTLPELAETYARDVDAVLFTGGVDLHPSLYGDVARRGLGEVDPDRDAFEVALYRAARALGKPVFGICRGFQLINALEGGTLWQHLPDADGIWGDHAQVSRPPVLAHPVTFAPGSQLARTHADGTLVNSYHHQGVRDLAPTLTATAFAPDGLIEGVEGDGIIAVQWHPELTFDRHPATFGTFAAFLASMGVTA